MFVVNHLGSLCRSKICHLSYYSLMSSTDPILRPQGQNGLFLTPWSESHQEISYLLEHWNHLSSNLYSCCRCHPFRKTCHSGWFQSTPLQSFLHLNLVQMCHRLFDRQVLATYHFLNPQNRPYMVSMRTHSATNCCSHLPWLALELLQGLRYSQLVA